MLLINFLWCLKKTKYQEEPLLSTAANEIVQAQNNYSTEITHNINDMYDIIKW